MSRTVTIRPANLQEVQAALRKYGDEARKAIGGAVQATGLEISTDISKSILRGPKTGAVYSDIFRMINGRPVPIGPRSGNNLSATHQASAPGEAPAADTGALSRPSAIVTKRKGDLTIELESTIAYAAYLEFGTQMIAPRPSWVPAVEKARPKFQLRITTAIGRLV
jgi:hypothetical protein